VPKPAHVRFGSKADMCNAKRHVRFTPESDQASDVSGAWSTLTLARPVAAFVPAEMRAVVFDWM
jgi:hypothetical protein